MRQLRHGGCTGCFRASPILRPLAWRFSLLLTVPTLLLAGQARGQEAISLWQGAVVENLLTPDRGSHLAGLSSEFVVPVGGHPILLTTGGDLFDLGLDHYAPSTTPLEATSVALSKGTLVVIRENKLARFESGQPVDRLALPSPAMKVVAGKGDRLYLYGPKGAGSSVYLLEGGKSLYLLDVNDARISDLTAIGERLFFSVGNAIYSVARDEPAGLVFVAPGVGRIRSLAVDATSGMVYFSAGETVYATRAGVAISILKGVEAVLRYANGALYVLDPGARTLLKLTGLEDLVLQTPPPARSVSVDDFKD